MNSARSTAPQQRAVHLARLAVTALLINTLATAATSQVAMWGFDGTRNMVSDAGPLSSSWNTETGEGILWSAGLGSQTYGGPLVLGDRIYVGTNNQALRNPALTGDRGVLMAFTRADGQFLWQVTHTKLPAGRVNDWPLQGICSTPYAGRGPALLRVQQM